MEGLLDLINNHVLFVSAFTWLAAQIVKVIVNLIVNKTIDLSRLFGDGGMPSGHSATVVSLAVLCGWGTGFNSAVFAVSLGLIVGGSVMLGNASGEVGELNSTIAALEAKQNELEGKLDLKYNVDEIEADAKSLGMIKRQYADNEYITVNGEEQITIYEDDEAENVGLAALLASFGIELD